MWNQFIHVSSIYIRLVVVSPRQPHPQPLVIVGGELINCFQSESSTTFTLAGWLEFWMPLLALLCWTTKFGWIPFLDGIFILFIHISSILNKFVLFVLHLHVLNFSFFFSCTLFPFFCKVNCLNTIWCILYSPCSSVLTGVSRCWWWMM